MSDQHPTQTSRRFDGGDASRIEALTDEVDRLKRVIRKAHNDLNDPMAIDTVRAALSHAILFPPGWGRKRG